MLMITMMTLMMMVSVKGGKGQLGKSFIFVEASFITASKIFPRLIFCHNTIHSSSRAIKFKADSIANSKS